MENELKKWQEITAGSPSAGRCSVADLWKLLDGATVEARRTDQPSSDDLIKRRIVERAMDILAKRLGDFPAPVMPEAKPYPSPSNAQFAPIRVSSLGELARLSAKEHSGQLETPTSTWREPVRKRERVSDDDIRQRELDAARTGDWESVVGKAVH